MSNNLSIKDVSKSVNMSFQEAKKSNWGDIGRFIVLGLFKLLYTILGYGALFWIIRHL